MVKHTIEKERIRLKYETSEYDGMIILAASSPPPRRLPNSNSVPLGLVNGKQTPPPMKDFMCSIWFVDILLTIGPVNSSLRSSRIPCRGFYSFCGVCFHGGHQDHIREWFRQHDECPTGCGHRCRDRDPTVRRSRPNAQRFLPRSSVVFQQ